MYMMSRMHSVHLIQLHNLPIISLQIQLRRIGMAGKDLGAYKFLDMGPYGGSNHIHDGETGVETMDHCCGVEKVGVSSPCQEPERV
jgi:hypothetical protein